MTHSIAFCKSSGTFLRLRGDRLTGVECMFELVSRNPGAALTSEEGTTLSAVEVRNLRKVYGTKVAVNDISFDEMLVSHYGFQG